MIFWLLVFCFALFLFLGALETYFSGSIVSAGMKSFFRMTGVTHENVVNLQQQQQPGGHHHHHNHRHQDHLYDSFTADELPPFKLQKPITGTLFDDSMAAFSSGLPIRQTENTELESPDPAFVFPRGYLPDGNFFDATDLDPQFYDDKHLQLYAANPQDVSIIRNRHEQVRRQFLVELDLESLNADFLEALR